MLHLPFNQINFSYKGLGTFLAKQFNQLTNSGWGSLGYTLDGDIFDAPSEPYKIEVPFEHMQFERLYDAGNSPPTCNRCTIWLFCKRKSTTIYR